MNDRWGGKDWIFIGVGWLALLGGCFLKSRGAPMWLDEIVTFHLIHDPSISHMISAIGDQCDGVPPLYHILARFWGVLFSSSELSLRLFSAAAFCASFALLFLVLRRRFNFWPSSLALAFAVGSNAVFRFEHANIRFYGLLFALITLAMFVAVQLVTRERPGVPLIIANILTQAALVLCHPFGGVYSAAIMAAVAVSDLVAARRVRIAVVGSYVAGWLALLLWWRQLLHQADVTNPHGWIHKPQLDDLRSALNAAIDFYPLILLFPLLWAIRAIAKKAESTATNEPLSIPLSLTKGQPLHLLMSITLIGVIPAVWVYSKLNPPHSLFLSRYLIGAAAGWAIVLAQLATYAIEPIGSRLKPLAKLMMAIAIIVGLLPLVHGKKGSPSYEDVTGAVDEVFGHNELPIVCPYIHDYVTRAHYSKHADRYYFLLDWPVATAPGMEQLEPVAVAEYKLLDALRRNYPTFGHIVDARDFLHDHDTFLVHDPGRRWVNLRLTPDIYSITPLKPTQLGDDWRMLLVKKKAGVNSD